MATDKITITLQDEQLAEIRALVGAGKARSVSGFVQNAVRVALFDAAGWQEMLTDAGAQRHSGYRGCALGHLRTKDWAGGGDQRCRGSQAIRTWTEAGGNLISARQIDNTGGKCYNKHRAAALSHLYGK